MKWNSDKIMFYKVQKLQRPRGMAESFWENYG